MKVRRWYFCIIKMISFPLSLWQMVIWFGHSSWIQHSWHWCHTDDRTSQYPNGPHKEVTMILIMTSHWPWQWRHNNLSYSPAQCDSRHRHPGDAADTPPFLASIAVARAALFILLLFLRSLAPVTTATAAVVYKEGDNDEEGENESNGRETREDQ